MPMAGVAGVHSVTLSGAGPSVLLIVDPSAHLAGVVSRIREASGEPDLEVLETKISGGATSGAAS